MAYRMFRCVADNFLGPKKKRKLDDLEQEGEDKVEEVRVILLLQ